MQVLQTYIDFDYIFNYKEKNKNISLNEHIDDIFERMFCSWYDKNSNLKEQNFFIKLNECMMEKKIIYVYVDFALYVIEKDKKDINQQINHSTAMIFYPSNNKYYNVYHFNSHGNCGTYINQYELYITRKRSKQIKTTIGLDRFIIGKFVESYNKHIDEYVYDSILLNYNYTKNHNYVGTNLQINDENGVCYMYPFILFYELNEFYNTKNKVYNTKGNYQSYPTYKNLLYSNKIDLILYLILNKYDKIIGQSLYDYSKNLYKKNRIKIKETRVRETEYNLYDTIEDILINNKDNHILKMHNKFINYTLNPKSKKKTLKLLKRNQKLTK